MRRVHRACNHRRLVVTRRGYIGLVPWGTRTGDVVFVGRGGKTPFVLRRAAWDGMKGERWRVVGEGYVYGMMAGEVWGMEDVGEEMVYME